MISFTITSCLPVIEYPLVGTGDELKLYFHIDASGQIQFHQSIHRLLGRIQDIEEPFVGSNFELFP